MHRTTEHRNGILKLLSLVGTAKILPAAMTFVLRGITTKRGINWGNGAEEFRFAV